MVLASQWSMLQCRAGLSKKHVVVSCRSGLSVKHVVVSQYGSGRLLSRGQSTVCCGVVVLTARLPGKLQHRVLQQQPPPNEHIVVIIPSSRKRFTHNYKHILKYAFAYNSLLVLR